MLTAADKYYIDKHAKPADESWTVDQDVQSLVEALGKKPTPKLRECVRAHREKCLVERDKRQARSEVIGTTAGGKKNVAVMTQAGSMRPASSDPGASRTLKGCVHKIGPAADGEQ